MLSVQIKVGSLQTVTGMKKSVKRLCVRRFPYGGFYKVMLKCKIERIACCRQHNVQDEISFADFPPVATLRAESSSIFLEKSGDFSRKIEGDSARRVASCVF